MEYCHILTVNLLVSYRLETARDRNSAVLFLVLALEVLLLLVLVLKHWSRLFSRSINTG